TPSQITAAQVAATIPASLLTTSGTAQVAVADGRSEVRRVGKFRITPTAAAPSITSLTPNTASAGSGSTSVTIAGSGLALTAKVSFTSPGGTATLITPSQITAAQVAATIPASLLTTSGTAQVAVADG